MITYCMGFMFTEDKRQVLLVEKQHGPKFLHGKWNGIGGKLEEGETARQALIREFTEEVPWQPQSVWDFFCNMTIKQNEDARVVCFQSVTTSPVIASFGPMTNDVGELVLWCSVDDFEIMPWNLRWLLPMAAYPGLSAEITENL